MDCIFENFFITFDNLMHVKYLLVCLFWLHGMWDLSVLIRDGTQAPCIGNMES